MVWPGNITTVYSKLENGSNMDFSDGEEDAGKF